MRYRLAIFLTAAAAALAAAMSLPPWKPALTRVAPAGAQPLEDKNQLQRLVERLDQWFEARQGPSALAQPPEADDLLVLRRIALALVGSPPSLQEIREFEADHGPDRRSRWVQRYLQDPRFGAYFAQRLAVVFTGVRENRHPWFGREHFEAWLAAQLMRGRAYDEIVRDMITARGPPRSSGAGNFVTAEAAFDEAFAGRLAARASRAYLGQRIDCAGCHDHPFEPLTQADFHGLAAFLAPVRTVRSGLADDSSAAYLLPDRATLERRPVEPRVPYGEEWLGAGTARERLAGWITNPAQRRFGRAIANRAWGLMFGKPLHAPVDGLPEDGDNQANSLAPLNLLAEDFIAHGRDLRRLLAAIAASRAFRAASTDPPREESPGANEPGATSWTRFSLTPLGPEQLARSLRQAALLRPVGTGELLVPQLRREHWNRQFIEQYGALGEDELDERTETVPRVIERMEGRFTREMARATWFSSAGLIAHLAESDRECLEACYLVCLTRRPTPAESAHFLEQLRGKRGARRARLVEDIFWSLFNSPEFCWNH